jgi:hypothetical protein
LGISIEKWLNKQEEDGWDTTQPDVDDDDPPPLGSIVVA